MIWLVRGSSTVLRRDVGFNLGDAFAVVCDYGRMIFSDVFSPVLVGVLLVIAFFAGIRENRLPRPLTRQGSALLLLFVVFNVLVFSLVTPFCEFRYLTPSLPLLCILAARVLEYAVRPHPAVGVVGLAAVVMFFTPIGDYAYEITHHIRGPTEGMVNYLNAHGSPDDVVAITFGDTALKFYTRMRVVSAFAGDDPRLALKAKWVIYRHDVLCKYDYLFRRYLQKHLHEQDYRRIELDYPDVAFDNRETPEAHIYRSVTGAPPVVILERIAR
jgi:hypothetical protein